MKPVCLVVGAGAGIGGSVGKRFAREGYHTVLCRRTDQDGLMLPDKMAATYFHIAQQHRSAWTHEVDMRSFSDLPWWNH